ncbi:hypothetical protein [Burkholderia glumae]|uniref:hypothetical protein n=1 Tax=Burkholderia glumae TaxID=337 RepID=UPI00215097C7|nr:hypothetical protein [Burkholderia glumae]
MTGVLNGMFLRKDGRIWPSNTQPFCAVVSINEQAGPEDSFYFLVPRHEPALAERREFRLDPRSAMPVPVSMAAREPHAFKTLARGSALDLELISRLENEPHISMRKYLEQEGLEIAQGFIAGKRGLQDASMQRGLPVLEGPDKPMFSVETEGLDLIEDRYPQLAFQWPRSPAIYVGPHLLFREAPKQDPAHRGALVTDGDVMFSRSFYGVPIPDTKKTVRDYLYVLSYSDLLMYWVLMTSSKFGVERDIFNKDDYRNFPIVETESLSAALKKKVVGLAAAIRAGEQPWHAVNAVVAQIYSLTSYDQALIADALAYESPFASSQTNGLALVPRSGERLASFSTSLASILTEAEGSAITVIPYNLSADDGLWQFMRIAEGTPLPIDPVQVASLLKHLGDPLMTSEIRLQLGEGDWMLGRLRHARYWSDSQARLLALDFLERGLFSSSASH